jgi:hypothetical protein
VSFHPQKYTCCYAGDILLNVTLGKGTAIPVQTWTGTEGSRRLRLPDFMTTPAIFTLQEIFLVLISVRGWVDLSAMGSIQVYVNEKFQ